VRDLDSSFALRRRSKHSWAPPKEAVESRRGDLLQHLTTPKEEETEEEAASMNRRVEAKIPVALSLFGGLRRHFGQLGKLPTTPIHSSLAFSRVF